MSLPRIAAIVGTRPEVIKLYPVIRALQACARCECVTIGTGQQREMQQQAAAGLGLRLDHDLAVMTAGQTLPDLTARLITELSAVLERVRPALVLVQGDTTTALAGALCAFYRQIPVGHVEAGLRTHDRYLPFPEEANRRMVAAVTELHFAPTAGARENLLAENVASGTIHVTGNTVVDALRLMVERQKQGVTGVGAEAAAFLETLGERRLVLVTGHRRENLGEGLLNICRALAQLAEQAPEAVFAFPVHKNPRVREPVERLLGALPNLHLLPPFAHAGFLALLKRAHLVLTDSGGVQEEATALGCPTLILRDHTERPEAVASGVAELVGTGCEVIVARALALLRDSELHRRRSAASQVFGDGQAGRRIAEICLDYLSATR